MEFLKSLSDSWSPVKNSCTAQVLFNPRQNYKILIIRGGHDNSTTGSKGQTSIWLVSELGASFHSTTVDTNDILSIWSTLLWASATFRSSLTWLGIVNPKTGNTAAPEKEMNILKMVRFSYTLLVPFAFAFLQSPFENPSRYQVSPYVWGVVDEIIRFGRWRTQIQLQ